jgi:hypothetical protein
MKHLRNWLTFPFLLPVYYLASLGGNPLAWHVANHFRA